MLPTMLSWLPPQVATGLGLPDWRVVRGFIRRAFLDAQPLLERCYDKHGG